MALLLKDARELAATAPIGLVWIGGKYTICLSRLARVTFGEVVDDAGLRIIIIDQMRRIVDRKSPLDEGDKMGGSVAVSARVAAAVIEMLSDALTPIRVSVSYHRPIDSLQAGTYLGLSYSGVVKRVVVISATPEAVMVAFHSGEVKSVLFKYFERNNFMFLDSDGACLLDNADPAPRGGAPSAVTSKEEDADCIICYEPFTKRRVRVECTSCGTACCHKCITRNLEDTTEDAKCMKCNMKFDRTFLLERIGITFVAGPYRKLRKRNLFEYERARMPHAMDIVPAYKNIIACKKKITQLRTSYEDTLKLYDSVVDALVLGDLNKTLQRITSELSTTRNMLHNSRGIVCRGSSSKKTDVDRREFRHACSFDDCRGFLTTAWKCPVCTRRTCRHCLVGIVGDEVHVCDEGDVESVKTIRKETRNCPSCASRIYKIDGCDQMWCTQCHVAFSWKTGRTVKGRIHNPHFFEWRRKNEDERVPNAAVRDAANGDCRNRAPDAPLIEEITICIASAKQNARSSEGTYTLRHVSDDMRRMFIDFMNFRHNTVFSLARQVQREQVVHRTADAAAGRDDGAEVARNGTISELTLRLQYLVGDTTKARFQTTLIKRDNMKNKREQTLAIYELVVAVVCDRLRALTMERSNTCYQLVECMSKIHKVVEFANGQLANLSRAYCNCVLGFFVKNTLRIEKRRGLFIERATLKKKAS